MIASNESKAWKEGLRLTGPTLQPLLYVLALLALLPLAACTDTADGPPPSGDRLAVDLDKSNEERLLRYYLGGYLNQEGGDPAEDGLLLTEGGYAINPQRLDVQYRRKLEDANGDGTLDWDEFAAFVEATYASARNLPRSLDTLRARTGYAEADSSWFTVELDGVMTAARRRIHVPVAAIRSALEGFGTAGDELHYPEGTVLVGEHLIDGEVVETTVKWRRADGFWDFAVYDAAGRLAAGTTTEPKPLRAPTQCVGCHLGQRLFDPEKSFPAPAPDGPFGPRAIHVPSTVRNLQVVQRFDEHAKRSDGVLGLYATLYVSGLIADRMDDVITPEDEALLQSLGL